MKTLLITAVLVFLLSGCSVLQQVAETPVRSELIASQITLRLIARAEEPVARAQGVRFVIERVRARTEGTRAYTLAEFERMVREEIDWAGMPEEDRQLLEYGLGLAREALLKLVGQGIVSLDDQVTITTLLDWIDTAAARVSG